jgi:hypothetical protein
MPSPQTTLQQLSPDAAPFDVLYKDDMSDPFRSPVLDGISLHVNDASILTGTVADETLGDDDASTFVGNDGVMQVAGVNAKALEKGSGKVAREGNVTARSQGCSSLPEKQTSSRKGTRKASEASSEGDALAPKRKKQKTSSGGEQGMFCILYSRTFN